MVYFWKYVVDYIGYIIVMCSVLVAVNRMLKEPVQEAVQDYRMKLRVRKTKETKSLDSTVGKFSESRFYKHIYFMVRSTSKSRADYEVALFFAYTAVIFVTTFMVLTFKTGDIVVGVFVSLGAATIPYCGIKIRMNKLRHSISADILNVLRSLSQNYSVSGNDIRRALIKTTDDVVNKDFKKILYGLLSDMQSAKNEEELRASIDTFTYSLGGGSSWARRLGGVIRKSHIHKENVLETLLTLTKQIEATEEMLEQEKSKNIDTLMTGYGAIPSLLISVGLGKMIASGQNWIALQFGTSYCLAILVATAVLSVIATALSMLLGKPGNDL